MTERTDKDLLRIGDNGGHVTERLGRDATMRAQGPNALRASITQRPSARSAADRVVSDTQRARLSASKRCSSASGTASASR